MMAYILFTTFVLGHVAAIPTLSYPFNSQVPPVARAGALYNYTFPANTFANYQSNVVYSLAGAPAWLSLDSSARRIQGTPTTTDVGNAQFSLVATDPTGAAYDPVVLVVSASSGPYVAMPLISQLQGMGRVDGRGGLILTSASPFQITFSQNTFAETGGNVTAYYGTSDNYTPLPSWIFFDPNTITFRGTAPTVVSLLAPPQYFEFVLVGTDYPGFAGISASFQIVVGAHQLSFSTVDYTRTVNLGEQFTFHLPLDQLKLDEATIAQANISTSSANTTGTWLSYDPMTYSLSGVPSTTSANHTKVALSVTDVFGDVASLNLAINLNNTQSTTNHTTNDSSNSSSIISGSLPVSFNATAGTFFTYTFNSSVIPTSASIAVAISGASWLHYNADNRTLYGQVPSTTSKGKRQTTSSPSVTITATQNGQTQTQTVGVDVVAATTTPTTNSGSTSTAATSTTSAASSSLSSGGTGSSQHSGLSTKKKLAIGLGIAIPIVVIALAVLLFCCCRRRSGASSVRSATSSNISRPVGREKDEWPQATDPTSFGEPRQLGAFEMFKSTSEGRLSGYAVEVNSSGILAAPLAPIAHELPPLPESPGFEAVRSAYGSDESQSQPSSVRDTMSMVSRRTLSENHSIPNIQAAVRDPMSIKPVINARRSALQLQDSNRGSTNTMDSVSTDELFSVRLVGDEVRSSVLAPPLATHDSGMTTQSGHIMKHRLLTASNTQQSAQTIGTYTSSEGDYIQRYGSQGESLSSGMQSQNISNISRNNSNQPQPWRVMNSQDSYGSFGSYATTDSNLSDEFSFDESLSGDSNERRVFEQRIAEESEDDEGEISHATRSPITTYRPESDGVMLEAPLSPDWATSPRQPSVARRPTLNERVASIGKGRLMESTARRPMSSASIGSPDVSADTTEESAEIAFV